MGSPLSSSSTVRLSPKKTKCAHHFLTTFSPGRLSLEKITSAHHFLSPVLTVFLHRKQVRSPLSSFRLVRLPLLYLFFLCVCDFLCSTTVFISISLYSVFMLSFSSVSLSCGSRQSLQTSV